jgi:hypothetical protein
LGLESENRFIRDRRKNALTIIPLQRIYRQDSKWGDVYNGWVDGGVRGCGWEETDGLMVGRWGDGVILKPNYLLPLFPVPCSLFPIPY